MQKQSWKHLFILFFTLMVMGSPILASTGEALHLNVAGDFPIIGTLRVSVFQSLEDFYAGRPAASVVTPVTSTVNSVTLPPPPEGPILISVNHDANSDGRMNANAFGVPTESSRFYVPDNRSGPVRPRDAFFDLTNRTGLLELILPDPPADPRTWGLGVMTLVSSNPYRGGDTVVRVLPSLTYIGERLFVIGPRVGVNLLKNRWLNINALADYKFAGDAFEDEKFLAGMDKRRDTVMAGFDAGLRALGPWRLESQVLTDVLNRHDGQEANLTLNRTWRGKRWGFTPGAGLIWRSENYNDYYFGVNESEATDERPAYSPGHSVEWFARILLRYQLGESWSLNGLARIELLSDDVTDSPIVDKSQVTTTFMALTYMF